MPLLVIIGSFSLYEFSDVFPVFLVVCIDMHFWLAMQISCKYDKNLIIPAVVHHCVDAILVICTVISCLLATNPCHSHVISYMHLLLCDTHVILELIVVVLWQYLLLLIFIVPVGKEKGGGKKDAGKGKGKGKKGKKGSKDDSLPKILPVSILKNTKWVLFQFIRHANS